jgi:hypothetical protein
MHTDEMYELFFLEHTEFELYIVAVFFNHAGILDIGTCVLTLCLVTSVKASSNTVTIQPTGKYYCCVRRVKTVHISDHFKPCLKRSVSSKKKFFGLSMILDLDNHNYCMQQVAYDYLSFTELYISVAVNHTLSVCRVPLKKSMAQNYTALLQPSQTHNEFRTEMSDTWKYKYTHSIPHGTNGTFCTCLQYRMLIHNGMSLTVKHSLWREG